MSNRRGCKYFSVGDVLKNNDGDEFKIIEYIDAHNVVIEWPCCQQDVMTSGNIRSGGVAYYNRITVQGIGYLGYGRFVHGNRKLKDGQLFIPKHLHRHWRHLISRTCGDKPDRYEDATMDSKWYNLQNFLEWAVKQIGNSKVEENGRYWCIDKDILVEGNKHYSESTCLFVPNDINVFFARKDIGNTGYLGVNYIKPATKGAKEGHIARCHNNGERQYLGYFDTAYEAYLAYRTAKINAAKELADRFKGEVDVRVTDALLNYEDRLPINPKIDNT